LVYGWAHWIVIRGFDADKAPLRALDPSYHIQAFWINDPAPPGSTRNPPSPPSPHSNKDLCGSGGQNYGNPNEHILYQTWQSDYMTGVPQGRWVGKFLAVCDPSGKRKEKRRKEEKEKVGKKENEKKMTKKESNKKLIDKKKAANAAVKALKDHGLTEQPFLKEILQDVQPAEPVLVRHLDRKNAFYYIVPMVAKEKNIHALVSIEGTDGNYKQASFAKDVKNPIIFRPLSEKDILDLLRKQLNVKDKKIVISPHLVWMPCMESFSPYLPFYEVTIGDYQVYVRIDKQIFTKLTTGIPGA
jgi:hypothetical protein